MRERISPCSVSGSCTSSTRRVSCQLPACGPRTSTPLLTSERMTSSMKKGLPSVLCRICSRRLCGKFRLPTRLLTRVMLFCGDSIVSFTSYTRAAACRVANWRTRSSGAPGSSRAGNTIKSGVARVSGSRCSARSTEEWSAQCQSSSASTTGWRRASSSKSCRMHRKTWRRRPMPSRYFSRSSCSAGAGNASTVARYGSTSPVRSPKKGCSPRSSLPQLACSPSSSAMPKQSFSISMNGQ